jgi:hypothetical protein
MLDPLVPELELRRDVDAVWIEAEVAGRSSNQRRAHPQAKDAAVRIVLPCPLQSRRHDIDITMGLNAAVMVAVALAISVDRWSEMNP